ncbi:TAF9 RNA polymerase II, TATA box binding protein (TBP)-associated factor isoform 1-like protein [Camelus ferus]|nr:TAF9 RNA polymerase II, TATA box binding protein (TBP)-associated factor isoform 1-like protein [Camelus ferus]
MAAWWTTDSEEPDEVMAQILKDMGITEYEPRVINQMLEFAFRYVTTILDDAKIYSSHAKKPNVDADDVRLAIQCRADQSFTSPPPRDNTANESNPLKRKHEDDDDNDTM